MISDETSELEPGSDCPHPECAGTLDTAPTRNCSCHLSAPCSACTSAGLLCDTCGWDSTPDEEEEPTYQWTGPERGSRRGETTSTHTANPFNSTPFTRCCGVAAIGTDRCPHCEAKITYHDDGLAALRRKVGPGNCLMCGKKRNGGLGDRGVCCC